MTTEIDSSHLIKIKITQLIKFASSFSGVEVHVSLGGKFIKMNYANDQFIDILRRLQQKEVEEVYINQTDCTRVLNEIQTSMSPNTFYDPSTTNEQRIETIENSVEVVKNVINQLGVDKQTMEILKTVNKRTTSMVQESPSVFMFLKEFKKNCSEEFLRSVLTGYLTSMVIDTFPWKSEPVKEKAALASLLCDITLTKADFAIMKDHEKNGTALEDRIRNHPHDIAKILGMKKDIIPSETITIIEQHHELPNGKGFPNAIELHRFNQLSSIFIVSQKFIEYLFEEKFDYSKRHEILKTMLQTYHGRTFDKAMAALVTVVG